MLGILLLSNIAPQIIHCGVNKPSRLVKSQELLGHLTNEDPVPPQYIIPDSSNTPTIETYAPRITKAYIAWRKADCLLQGWIIGTLSEETLGLAVGLDTPNVV